MNCLLLTYIALWVTRKTKKFQKNKLFAFYFPMYHPISLNHLSVVRQYEKCTAAAEVAAVAGTAGWPGRRRFSSVINNSFLAMSKHLTTNTCCWSRKTLVVMILYWMHLRLNTICTKSLYRQKTTEHRSSQDAFRSNAVAFNALRWCHSDVTIMKVPPGGRN